jgi:hypothetical protein
MIKQTRICHTSAKQQDKKILILWAKLVKLKAGNKCEKCGSVKFLNAHHIYGRNNYNCRYDLDNGCSLCSGCHKWRRDSAHNAPLEFIELMITKRGQSWFSRLQKKATKDIFKQDKDEIEKLLTKQLKKLEGR